MMRALITLTLAASATLAAAAEVQVPPAVALAADMVESRIVEGHPSARWLRAVSTGLRSGRITIQEASALLAMINHQAAFTAGPVLGQPAPMPVQPAPAPVPADGEDLAATLPEVEPEPVAEPEPVPSADSEPALTAEEEAELAQLDEQFEVLDALEADVEADVAAESAAPSEAEFEVAEEGGAGGLMEVPTAAAAEAPGTAAEAMDPAAADELAALAAAADALAAVDQAPAADESEPDVEGALEALSRPKTPAGAEVFAAVETDDPPAEDEPAAEAQADPPAQESPVVDEPAAVATGPDPAPPTAAPAATPPVAEVVHVKLPLSADDPTLVMVEGVGVRKGQTLSVRRDGREAVRVLVLRVEGTLSMAMVLGASWQPDAQRPLVVGDRVWPVGG